MQDRRIFRPYVCAFFALAFLSAIAVGQRAPGELAHTNFSGRWRMVKEQSDFAGFHVPDVIVRVVDQHDPNMNVHTVQISGTKSAMADIVYSIDGAVTKNVIGGRDAESKAFWDGPTLVIRTNMKNAKGEDETILDRWDLSPDKNTLTIASHVELPENQTDMKLVCAREKGGR